MIATLDTTGAEYSIDDAAVDIDELIAQLEEAKEDGATKVVGLTGNYRGARFVKLGKVSIDEESY